MIRAVLLLVVAIKEGNHRVENFFDCSFLLRFAHS